MIHIRVIPNDCKCDQGLFATTAGFEFSLTGKSWSDFAVLNRIRGSSFKRESIRCPTTASSVVANEWPEDTSNVSPVSALRKAQFPSRTIPRVIAFGNFSISSRQAQEDSPRQKKRRGNGNVLNNSLIQSDAPSETVCRARSGFNYLWASYA